MLESVQCSLAMNISSNITIQVLVFSLVAAAFTTIYITQPVLPVIQAEFAVDPRTASLSISVVILGIALSNLPFGILRSEEHTSELQSLRHLVCRLLLEK